MTELECGGCGESDWGTFVQYGSYVYKCLTCGQNGPVTSFMAIAPGLVDQYEAIIVDDELNEEKVLTIGIGSTISKVVAEAANTGKLVWLKLAASATAMDYSKND
ncbi:MAG: hypothetical protein GY847_17585 [Proteobacteria bacterium]|nr:hypothetical protein [Pseudomonadota bacterium]